MRTHLLPHSAVLAAALAGCCALTAADPQPPLEKDTGIRLVPGKWYAAEPWHRVEANRTTLEAWAKKLAKAWEGKAEPVDAHKVRWAVSALALHHAARVSGDAGKAWRAAADGIIARKKAELNPKDKSKAHSYADLGFSHQPNYAAPFLLLYLEHRAAGVETAKLWKGGDDDDRDPISSLGITKDLSRERLAAQVVLNMVTASGNATSGPDIGASFPPNQSCDYNHWNTPTPDPGVTGTVLMGMQSAMNLRVLEAVHRMANSNQEFDPAPFVKSGKNAHKVTADDFRNRWCDTLVHTMLTYAADRNGNTFDHRKSNALIERGEGTDFKDLPSSWSYGYRYAREAEGKKARLARQVMVRGPTKRSEKNVAVRRYRYGNNIGSPYQIASGGYTLLVAAQLLRRTLKESADAGMKSVGKQYSLTLRDGGEKWDHSGDTELAAFTLSFEKQPRYSGVGLSGPAATGGKFDVDDLVDEALTALVADLYPGGKLNAAPPYRMYAVGKFLTATGHPEVIGPYLWHRDFCAAMTTPEIKFQDSEYDDAFVILLALQAYQPLYPGGV